MFVFKTQVRGYVVTLFIYFFQIRKNYIQGLEKSCYRLRFPDFQFVKCNYTDKLLLHVETQEESQVQLMQTLELSVKWNSCTMPGFHSNRKSQRSHFSYHTSSRGEWKTVLRLEADENGEEQSRGSKKGRVRVTQRPPTLRSAARRRLVSED